MWRLFSVTLAVASLSRDLAPRARRSLTGCQCADDGVSVEETGTLEAVKESSMETSHERLDVLSE